MELLDTLRLRRNLYGYPEETLISIYSEWVRGMQVFVIHPHHNDTDKPWDAQRYGIYTFSYEVVCRFMQAFHESWLTGYPCEIKTNTKLWTRDEMYMLAYDVDENPDDPYTYRLIVRELHWRFFDDRFVVDNLKNDNEQVALRELRVSKYARGMLFPLEQAKRTAACLSCINVESMWSQTNRKLFHQPEIVIQRALKTHLNNGIIYEDHWSDFQIEHFIGFDWVLKFNGDFTNARIIQQ